MHIPVSDSVILKGMLNIPEEPAALVIFSGGRGTSRFSKRNRYIADTLNYNSIATLLVDLLTEKEDRDCQNLSNINLLTKRLIEVTNYVTTLSDFKNLPVGYLGESTGAASALNAAADPGNKISAVVSIGGRADLSDRLSLVKSPVLLIVESLDTDIIVLNRRAYKMLCCTREIKIVEGAGHLFEEPDKLKEVARLALTWFKKYLAGLPLN